MARIPIPIPGADKDYESRKSRAKLINCMVETNRDGSFKAIVKREGVDVFGDTTENGASDGIISNLVVSDQEVFFAGTSNIYAININATFDITSQGAHSIASLNGSDFLNSAADPFGNVFYSEQNSGVGVFLDDGGTINTVADADYTTRSVRTVTYLIGRFFFADLSKTGPSSQQEFFASDVLDPSAYNPLVSGNADEQNGFLMAVVSNKSSLHVFTTRHIEYWQTSTDSPLPLRRVQGATHKIGLLDSQQVKAAGAGMPIDQLYEWIGFVGSDLKVYLMENNQITVLSDLSYMLQVDQDESGQNVIPYLYFVDGPDHKYLCVTSIQLDTTTLPGEGSVPVFTWCYDLKTGRSHYRTSPTLDYWKYYYSAYQPKPNEGIGFFPPKKDPTFMRGLPSVAGTPVADINIYQMYKGLLDDNGTDFEVLLQTESISFDRDVSIASIEIEMETGVGNADSAAPSMTIKYSKDGGENFTTWGTVLLGGSTDKSKRVKMNSFGRLIRHTDFVLQLTMSEPVKFEVYGIYAITKD